MALFFRDNIVGNALFFADPEASLTPVFGITSVTPIKLGEPFTITTVNSAIALNAAATVSATLGGVALTGITGLTADTVTFDAPTGQIALDAFAPLVITVDAVASSSSSQQFLAPTGYTYVTLIGVSVNSWLNDPDYVGNAGGTVNNLGAGDQIVYQSLTTEDSNAVTITSTGLIILAGAATQTVDQTIGWFSLDAQDGYQASTSAVLTLDVPEGPVIPGPVLSLPTAVTTGVSTGLGSVTTDTATGYIYYLVSLNVNETVATIKTGSTVAVTTAGINTVSVTGLEASQAYYIHYLHVDGAGNDSNAVRSSQFTMEDAVALVVLSTSVLQLGQLFTITTLGNYDLTTVSSITATLNGITLAGLSNITVTSCSFVCPNQGVSLINPSELILTITV